MNKNEIVRRSDQRPLLRKSSLRNRKSNKNFQIQNTDRNKRFMVHKKSVLNLDTDLSDTAIDITHNHTKSIRRYSSLAKGVNLKQTQRVISPLVLSDISRNSRSALRNDSSSKDVTK